MGLSYPRICPILVSVRKEAWVNFMPLSLTAVQLVASRLCHDLAGPISAIGAGVESLADSPGDAEAVGLIQDTFHDMSARLAFFRLAFGHGGAGLLKDSQQFKHHLDTYFKAAGGRHQAVWPREAEPLFSLGDKALRFVMLAFLTVSDCLPRGGTLTISVHDLDEGLGLGLKGEGDKAKLRDDIQSAWDDFGKTEEGLSARNIHVHLARAMAGDIGAEVELMLGEDGAVMLAAVLPKS